MTKKCNKFEFLKKVNDLIPIRKEDTETKIKKEKMHGFMDAANILCIIPKTKELMEEFEVVFSKIKTKSAPDLKFKSISCYDLEYLKKIIELFEAKGSDEVFIKCSKDYPICIEDKNMKCILAHRIANDDKEGWYDDLDEIKEPKKIKTDTLKKLEDIRKKIAEMDVE